MKKLAALLSLWLGLFCSPALHAEDIRIRNADGEKEQLVLSILKLILSKTAPNANLIIQPEKLTEARLVSEVESGNLDIMWAGAAKEKDERLEAVRIPILKGLLGHRIFIIREADRHKFEQIRSLADLKRYDAGQGTFWGDTQVLKSAGIPTTTTIKYANLFPMLEGGRFDYFPRAVHEPWVEVRKRPELNLVVDRNVLLIYPFAMYFYLNKSNTKLHDMLQTGFEMAIKDGSFDELFFNHPTIREVLEKADLTKRRIFRIPNPNMHPDTPSDREEFWLDITKL